MLSGKKGYAAHGHDEVLTPWRASDQRTTNLFFSLRTRSPGRTLEFIRPVLSAIGADREFCPVCVLHRAFGAESAATGESGSASESAGSLGDTEGTPQVRPFENYEVMLDEAGRPIELGRGAMGVTYKGWSKTAYVEAAIQEKLKKTASKPMKG